MLAALRAARGPRARGARLAACLALARLPAARARPARPCLGFSCRNRWRSSSAPGSATGLASAASLNPLHTARRADTLLRVRVAGQWLLSRPLRWDHASARPGSQPVAAATVQEPVRQQGARPEHRGQHGCGRQNRCRGCVRGPGPKDRYREYGLRATDGAESVPLGGWPGLLAAARAATPPRARVHLGPGWQRACDPPGFRH